MANPSTSVKVSLKTIIHDPNEREQIDVVANGRLSKKDDTYVLQFNETTEDGNSVRNMVTISKNKISIKRSGYVRMNQIFREQMMTESTYYHPFGMMRMETTTERMDVHVSEDGKKGNIHISYLLSLNEQEPQKHEMALTFERKE